MDHSALRKNGIIWVNDAEKNSPQAVPGAGAPMRSGLMIHPQADEGRLAHADGALTLAQPVTLPVAVPDSEKIAVVLNANARRVTRGVLRRIWRLMGKDHVYYSRSIDEAEGFVREIVQKGYGTVLCGGGDGTITNLINMLYRYIDESNHWRQLLFERTGEIQPLLGRPRIGSLKLGTGNGLSGVLGTTAPIENLVRVLENKVGRTVSIPMIEAEGEHFFFGGQGYDAQILNDYNWIKEKLTTPILSYFSKGLPGYFTAILSRTMPRAILSGASVEMRVINTGSQCYYIDPRRGDRLVEVEHGEVLFEGPLTMAGVATTPFYGYGLKVYPFAGLHQNLMHLRLADMSPMHAFFSIPSMWKGSLRSFRHIKDFWIESVRIELARPFPYQHSGEGKGYRDLIEYRLSDRRVEFLDFYEQRF
jgi:diacylglycerol kinase family enzyme